MGFRQKKNKKKKTLCIRLSFFRVQAVYKTSRSWLKWTSSFISNKRSNGQVRDITLPMFYGIQSKVISVISTLVLKKSEFQDPCSSSSLDIVFPIAKIAKSKRGHNSINVLQNSLKVNQVILLFILSCMPNIRILARSVLKISC